MHRASERRNERRGAFASRRGARLLGLKVDVGRRGGALRGVPLPESMPVSRNTLSEMALTRLRVQQGASSGVYGPAAAASPVNLARELKRLWDTDNKFGQDLTIFRDGALQTALVQWGVDWAAHVLPPRPKQTQVAPSVLLPFSSRGFCRTASESTGANVTAKLTVRGVTRLQPHACVRFDRDGAVGVITFTSSAPASGVPKGQLLRLSVKLSQADRRERQHNTLDRRATQCR